MKLRLIFTENEWGLLSIGGGAPCGKTDSLCERSSQGAEPLVYAIEITFSLGIFFFIEIFRFHTLIFFQQIFASASFYLVSAFFFINDNIIINLEKVFLKIMENYDGKKKELQR